MDVPDQFLLKRLARCGAFYWSGVMLELSIDQLLGELTTRKKYITEAQNDQLRALVKGPTTLSGGEALSDLLSEVQAQMTYLKTFRKQIIAKGDAASTREIKDMIQASTSLFTMLTNMNEDITNQDRLRKIENATVEVVRSLPLKEQERFFVLLEQALER